MPWYIPFSFGAFVIGLAGIVVGLAVPALWPQLAPQVARLLLLIAVVLVLIGVVAFVLGGLSWVRELLRERDRHQDTVLQDYFDSIRPLLSDEDKPLSDLPSDHPRREEVSDRTRRVLRRLDPEGKRDVFLFLREKVMKKDPRGKFPVVNFSGADFSGIDLSASLGRGLYGTYLVGADFSKADLNRVQFCDWRLDNLEDRYRLVEGRGSTVPGTPIRTSGLLSCDLSNAILKRTSLGGCDLWAADFKGADLGLADLRGANLELARNLTQKQIERAYGSRGHKLVEDTKLPDYLEAPEAWSKSIDEQKRERGDE